MVVICTAAHLNESNINQAGGVMLLDSLQYSKYLRIMSVEVNLGSQF